MFRLADLREMLRYVPQYRDRIFVIAVDGAIVECDNFRNLLLDIALLRSLRIGIAYGTRRRTSDSPSGRDCRNQCLPIWMARVSPTRRRYASRIDGRDQCDA